MICLEAENSTENEMKADAEPVKKEIIEPDPIDMLPKVGLGTRDTLFSS